jgi:ATP-dependent Lhr-like helicase
LEEVQEQLPFVDGAIIPIVRSGQNIFRFWTFAGGLTNAALAQVIPGRTTRSDDFCITIKGGSDAAAMDFLSNLEAVPIRPSFSSEMIRGLKFSSCLPQNIATSTIEARLLDQDGIQKTLARKLRLLHSAE